MLLASNTALYQNESEEDSVSSSSNRSGHPDALAYSLTYALLTGNSSQAAAAASITPVGLSVRRLSAAATPSAIPVPPPPPLIPMSAFQFTRKSLSLSHPSLSLSLISVL